MGRNKKIRIKNCEICNEVFDYGRHPETKTCSKECLIKYKDSNYFNNVVLTMKDTNKKNME